MTMTLERPEVGAKLAEDTVLPLQERQNGNGHAGSLDSETLASIRKGVAQDRWYQVMRRFDTVEPEMEFDDSFAERNFMARYNELETRLTAAKERMPWLYR